MTDIEKAAGALIAGALVVGGALHFLKIDLSKLIDGITTIPPEDLPPPGFRILPPDVEEPTEEIPPVVEEVLPEEVVEEPPFVDPFIPDLDPEDLPPALVGPIPEEVLERARREFGPSSPLGPLGLPSPFEEAEEAIEGFVAPPTPVFRTVILPRIQEAFPTRFMRRRR